jgi:hypothetical protein
MMEIAPLFQIDLSKRPSHFFFRFGPSVDLIFAGREQFDSLSANGGIDHASRPMVFDYTEYGHYGASGNFHFGYETKTGFMIFANYEHGIGSINNADNGPTILNRVIGLTAGWFFARSKRS